jgi:hypothetical protein
MQAAKPANQFVPGTQVKMIRVGKDDFRAQLFERFLCERFDRSLCADGKKKRRVHDAVRRGQATAPRARRVCFQDFKRKTHPLSVSGEDEGPTHATNNVDGPDGKGNREGLRAFQLSRIYRGEADR